MARFKVGDWIIQEHTFLNPYKYFPFITKILEISNNVYKLQYLDKSVETRNIEEVDGEINTKHYTCFTRLLTDEDKIELL